MSEKLMSFLGECGGSLPTCTQYNNARHEFDVTILQKDEENSEVMFKELRQINTSTLLQYQASIDPVASLTIAIIPHTQLRMELDEGKFTQLLEAFYLRNLFKLAHTGPMTFDVVPKKSNGEIVGVQYSLFVSNFIGLYVNCTRPGSACGIVWMSDTAEAANMPSLRRALATFKDWAQDPFFLLFIALVCLESCVNRRLSYARSKVWKVENQTGYEAWGHFDVEARLPSSGIEPYLPIYCAEMVGIVSTLASDRRFAKLCLRMVKVIKHACWTTNLPQFAGRQPLFIEAEEDLNMLQERLINTLMSIDVIETRVRSQITAVQNLINRHEMQLSLRLANSMKVLAIVTVVFLPATFVASLFSTTMFNWHMVGSDTVSNQFWIYWVVAIPLTAVTIVIFVLLNRRWKGPVKRRDEEADVKNSIPMLKLFDKPILSWK